MGVENYTITMSKRPRPKLLKIQEPPTEALTLSPPRNLDKKATITIDDKTIEVEADDLEKIADLGRGAYGVVEKMCHKKTGTVMAVKRITATVNTQEQVNAYQLKSICIVLISCMYYFRNVC